MKQRVVFPDIVRGLAILSVIEWHTMDIHFFWIDEWTMPAFFVIMGFFFKPDSNWRNLIVKKLKSLMVPLVLWSVPMFVIKAFSSSLRETLMNLVNPFDCVYGICWFMWCTLWCYLIYNAVCLLSKDKNLLKLILSLAISLIGFYISTFRLGGHRIQFPFYFTVSMTCTIFLCIGELLKPYLFLSETKLSTCSNCLIYGAIAIGGGVLFHFKGGVYDQNAYWDQNFLIYMTLSIMGVMSIMYVCKLLEGMPGIKFFSFCGEHSLLMLMVHHISNDYWLSV